MKKLIKTLALLAVLTVAFGFAGCSNSTNSSSDGGSSSSSTDVSRFFGEFKGTLTSGSETLGIRIEIGSVDGHLGVLIQRESGGGGIYECEINGSTVTVQDRLEANLSDDGNTLTVIKYIHHKTWTGDLPRYNRSLW